MLVEPRPSNHARHSVKLEDLSQRDQALWLALNGLIEFYTGGTILSESEEANFSETLPRAVAAWNEVFALDNVDSEDFRGIITDECQNFQEVVTPRAKVMPALKDILETGFPLEVAESFRDAGIITQGPIDAIGFCPHHLLQVNYEIYVAYKPIQGGMVLGLSKLARTARLLASRPVLQEQVSSDIADALYFDDRSPADHLMQIRSMGAAVQVIGSHGCMCCRGVRSDALTLTTTLRGQFQTSSLKEEFYQAIESIRQTSVRPVDADLQAMSDEDNEDEDDDDDDDEGEDNE